MALRVFVKTLDSVPSPLREHYKPDEIGFRLDLIDIELLSKKLRPAKPPGKPTPPRTKTTTRAVLPPLRRWSPLYE